MVYRVQPMRPSRVRVFLLAFMLQLLLVALLSLAFCCLMALDSAVSIGIVAGGSLLSALIVGVKTLRLLERLDWFSATPREYFLTLVDEGLVIESPVRGFTVYVPWQGLTCRSYGSLLQVFYRGVSRAFLSFHGVARERRAEILQELKRRSGAHPAQHGLFVPEQAAAPYAPAAAASAPAVAVPTLPQPAPMGEATEATYSNRPQQEREARSLLLRPGRLACVMIGGVNALLGALAVFLLMQGEADSTPYFFIICAILFILVLARPGWARVKLVPGTIHSSFTSTEYIERTEQGAWSRFRLPEEGKLVRLPHCWCLFKGEKLPFLLLDAEGEELPPALARYPRETAPRNGLRVLLSTLCLLLGALGGYAFDRALSVSPSEDELAFRALLPEPDGASLRAFVEEHYATGVLYDTPQLEPCPRQDGQGLAGYILTFTEEGAAPGEDGEGHFAWKVRLRLYPEGGVHDGEVGPAPWCPCEECFTDRLYR